MTFDSFYNVLDIPPLNHCEVLKNSETPQIHVEIYSFARDRTKNLSFTKQMPAILKQKKCPFERCNGQNKISASCKGC